MSRKHFNGKSKGMGKKNAFTVGHVFFKMTYYEREQGKEAEGLAAGLEWINGWLQPVLWGWPVLCLILLAGVLFTFRLGFFQVTHCGLWLKKTMGSLFCREKADEDRSNISPFQALTTALAGSIGTGNIVGVATALTLGGPGAIFWMWVSAGLGMMTIFAETVLGLKYRQKDKQGRWLGGAMYYLQYGLGSKGLAVVFAGACVLASFGMGNMAQSNSIGSSLQDTFGIPPLLTGGVVAVVLALVLMGGIQRIAKVTEKIVPAMSICYLLAGMILLGVFWRNIPEAFAQIFASAFDLRGVLGGVGGYGMLTAMRTGISRGIFTNEAGLGSSVMAHSSAETKEPVEQGMWGIFQVFIDTIVVCTITALCILCTNVMGSGLDGAALSAAAFQSVFGRFGQGLIAVSITFFAFATMLGWSYYGECALRYLCGLSRFLSRHSKGTVTLYRLVFAAVTLLGCQLELWLVWDVCDTLNGCMAIPNLIAVFFLSGEVVRETRSYLKRKRMGELGSSPKQT